MAMTAQVFQGNSVKLEFETIGLKGGRLWLETSAVPFYDDQQKIVALLGITRNITEQKKAAAVLNARIRLNEIAASASLDEMLQAALDQAETLTGSTIGFFHFLEKDQVTLKLQAWSTNTLANMCTAEGKGQHYPVDAAGVWVDCVREGKPVIHNDYAALAHKKGLPAGHAPIIRELLVPVIRDNRIDAVIGVGNKPADYTEYDVELLKQFAASACDIALRKKAEDALKESEERYRTVVDNIPLGVSLIGRDYRIIMTNKTQAGMFGRPAEWFKGRFCYEAFEKSAEACSHCPGKLCMDSGTLANVNTSGVRDDGGRFDVLVHAAPLMGDNQEPYGFIEVVEDITERKKADEERKRLEQQLLHAQKLESLGVLAGGIAHDFNNILMAIIGNADLALMRINRESPAVDNLHRIEQAAARAAELAKQMLAYSGKGKFVVENIDLNRLLEEMLHMLEVSISKKAVLRFNQYQPLPPVEADATQMRQIIMNLVINASEAIGDKSGVIAITTGCMDCDVSYLKDVWLAENICEGLYVYLEIADTGCGMDKVTMAKIFDPFFTTKFTGRGLGMAAVLGIVRGHKGAIKVYSEPGKGTSFKVLLPASSRPAELFNHIGHADDWHGEGTVLLVDDEETVRGIGAEMLKELGFVTITANDGREAVEIFKKAAGITFVILDLTMPHMDGEQCFRELRQLNPDVKVIMSSGYNEQEVTQKFAGKGLAGFIQKPYRLSELRRIIMGI
jgi:PAS domain S-box-containing protein